MALDHVVEFGLLAQTVPLFDSETIDTSAEITKDRRTNNDLRNTWIWTADSALYRVEGGEAVLYFGGRDTNLIFKNLEAACEALSTKGDYIPSQDDIQTVLESFKAGKTSRFRLSDLNLQGFRDEYSFFEIDTVYSDTTLNPVQRAFAEQVYGQGDEFEKSMRMLRLSGIEKIRIYVLNPDYVKSHVKGDKGISRACALSDFGGGSSGFGVSSRDVNYPDGALRGVRLAEGQ